MTARSRRHYLVPSAPLSRCLLLADLALALALLLARGAVPRLLVCVTAIPCSLATCAVLRWRACGDLKRSLAWSFVPVLAGMATWLAMS